MIKLDVVLKYTSPVTQEPPPSKTPDPAWNFTFLICTWPHLLPVSLLLLSLFKQYIH